MPLKILTLHLEISPVIICQRKRLNKKDMNQIMSSLCQVLFKNQKSWKEQEEELPPP